MKLANKDEAIDDTADINEFVLPCDDAHFDLKLANPLLASPARNKPFPSVDALTSGNADLPVVLFGGFIADPPARSAPAPPRRLCATSPIPLEVSINLSGRTAPDVNPIPAATIGDVGLYIRVSSNALPV